MGAVDAFVRTFTIMLAAKRLYLLALILALIMAPISAYLIPSTPPQLGYNESFRNGSVIVEEYGAPSEEEIVGIIEEFAKAMAIILVLSLLLGSVFQYAITKGALLHIEDKEYSLPALLLSGLRHLPGVLVINLVFSVVSLALIGVSLVPVFVGILKLPWGLILVFIGLVLTLTIAAVVSSLGAIPVPIYAEKDSVGAAFEAFGLVFNNLLSSMGFGFLLWVGIIGITVISSPIAFIVSVIAPENVAPYVSGLLQAPFSALLYEFMWVAGVAFYKELQKKEELKKVDEELMGLGVEV